MSNSEERSSQSQTIGKRFHELDSLRGIAAVTVVAHHTRFATTVSKTSLLTAPFFSGAQAVCLFFVLSGFVLSLPMWADRSPSYPVYLLRRFIRIYLPFAAAALLSVAGARFLWKSEPHISTWFDLTWHTPPSRKLLFDQLLMWPLPLFNTAFWSLRYELQLSILMPAIVWVMKRTNPLAITILSLVIAFTYPRRMNHWDTKHLLGVTIQVGSLFVLGASLAFYSTSLRSWIGHLGSGGWVVLLVSLFFYFCYPAQLQRGYVGDLGSRYMLVSGLGAAGVILCALELPSFARTLRHKTVEYFGRISYSLYLVHSIVIFSSFGLLYRRVPNYAIDIVIALVTLGAAHLFWLCVEDPSIRLIKRLRRSEATSLLPALSSLSKQQRFGL